MPRILRDTEVETKPTFNPEDLAAVEAVLPRFYALRDAMQLEADALEANELKEQFEHYRLDDLRLYLRQIETGLVSGEGTDRRLDALVRAPEARRLTERQLLGRPGIASLEQLRDRLRAEQAAAGAADTRPWPRPFRYTAEKGMHIQNGRVLHVGDVVDLTEAQAANFADKFEPAPAESAPA